MMLWKKGNERFALLIVAVVAVFGLVMMFNNSWNDDDSFTGFAAKKAVAKAKAPPPPLPEVKTCVDSDGGRILNVKGFVSGEYVNGQQYRFDDVCRGAQLTEYTCKSPSAMGVGMTACPRGSACQDGACVSLCGNDRADRGENCGTCPADVQCGADERCENNACVSRFFCRDIVGGTETDQGVSQNVCDPASSVATSFSCGAYYSQTHQVNTTPQNCGGRGCDVANARCCWRSGPSLFVCENDVRVNQSISVCDGQTRITPLPCPADRPVCTPSVALGGNATCAACSMTLVRASCDGLTLINETRSTCGGDVQTQRISCAVRYNGGPSGTCLVAENYAQCATCGQRACFNATNHDARGRLAPVILSIHPAQQCMPGVQDLGIVQCSPREAGERCEGGGSDVCASHICANNYRASRSVPNAETGQYIDICLPGNLAEGAVCDIHQQCQRGLLCDNETGGACRPGQRPG